MQIFFRKPNYTLVNVGQTKPRFYSKPFQIGQLDYIYARIARATFHLKAQKSVVFLSCQLTTYRRMSK